VAVGPAGPAGQVATAVMEETETLPTFYYLGS
jgi:hypothetical protein